MISFHSLEDRIVKETMVQRENPCTCPKEFPVCVCGKKPDVRRISRKPILPGEEELEENPALPQRQAAGVRETIDEMREVLHK